jgi:GntR family transcriptional regulator/MocR family aminotransferase
MPNSVLTTLHKVHDRVEREKTHFLAERPDHFVPGPARLISSRSVRGSRLWLRLDGLGTLFAQICRALRAAILAGELAPGSRVPSSRALADTLGVSRSTTVPVYEQLLAEGYLVSRRGSGTFVGAGPIASGTKKKTDWHRATRKVPRRAKRLADPVLQYPYDGLAELEPARYEMLYGVPDNAAFPRELWRRLTGRRLRGMGLRSLAYGPPEGNPELREAISEHINRTRGVRSSPELILITAGAQQAIDLVARALISSGDAVLIEDPHYLGARTIFLAHGAELVCAPVDTQGMRIQEVPRARRERCVLAYTTPSHQFPIGSILSLARRLDLLSWAESCGAYVIEDDYDGEFRFSGRPIESLQSLDERGRVIYVGTFSKTLFPSLRVGYLVSPPQLLPALRTAKWLADWSTPTLVQEVLASFLGDGHFDRHVRRVRARYAARHRALRDGLVSRLGERAIASTETGLHITAWAEGVAASRDAELAMRARSLGLGIHSINPTYWSAHPRFAGFVLGYGLVDEARIDDAAAIFARVVEESRRRSSAVNRSGSRR